MSVPNKKTVFIVDAMAFRRARAESFLSPWARTENVELISLDPDEAHTKLVERSECDMLIYNVGAPSAFEIFTEIQLLHTLRREAALAIVSDDENPAAVVAAIRSGAQGYLSNSMTPDLALQALSFVLHGGTYFPPTAIMAGHAHGGALPIEFGHHDFSQEQSLPGTEQQNQASPPGPGDSPYEQQGSLFDVKAAGVQSDNGTTVVRHAPEFTERQYAVLTCLCQGDPNKVIGRKLGMTETTVKVHVREIMRKLGVCNRTQVAIAAGRNGGPDGVTEMLPFELSDDQDIRASLVFQRSGNRFASGECVKSKTWSPAPTSSERKRLQPFRPARQAQESPVTGGLCRGAFGCWGRAFTEVQFSGRITRLLGKSITPTGSATGAHRREAQDHWC